MIGAQETGIKKLAVTWGFGEENDLMGYNPDWVAHQPADILQHLQLKTLKQKTPSLKVRFGSFLSNHNEENDIPRTHPIIQKAKLLRFQLH